LVFRAFREFSASGTKLVLVQFESSTAEGDGAAWSNEGPDSNAADHEVPTRALGSGFLLVSRLAMRRVTNTAATGT
jgi:hypothetical protein